ncbi:MAG: sialate O-acetylesterase [Chitinophagaceae bacterium]
MNNLSKNIAFLPIFCICLFTVAPAFANVKLPAIFSDGMVLQQQSKVSFWGWADAGEAITISGSWPAGKAVRTIADASGSWKLMMPTPAAGGPFTVSVAGKNNIILSDVLVGEVWVCSGQSNMGFTLKADANAKEEIAKADYPTLRYFSVKRQYGPGVFKDAEGSFWEKTSPATAPGFSAVAFYFAKKIQAELQVPVGIVFAAWGGTPAEAWTPAAVFKNDAVLSRYLTRWKDMYLTVGKDSTNYHKALDNWEKARENGDSTLTKKPEEPATLVWFNRPWREPSVLFNGMINPVIPYGIKGVLWYQGESNVNFADEYVRLFGNMIKSWRRQWGNRKDLPFYFVQIAPFAYSSLDAAARLRDAQYQVMQQVPNTGMAVTMDVGNMKDQHFTHKKEVGDRLAFIAMAKNYGAKTTAYKGPECKNAKIENGQVAIAFSTTTPGLTIKGKTLNGFEIGYRLPESDSIVYTNASAFIKDNKVILTASLPGKGVEVRYGWLQAGTANLFDKDGLPAFPFRKKIQTN